MEDSTAEEGDPTEDAEDSGNERPLPEELLEAYLTKVRDMVRDHGWMIQAVGEDPAQFQYTVGVWETAGLEFITFGLHLRVGGAILNHLARQVREGRRYAHGEVVNDLSPGYPAMLVDVEDSSSHLTVANRLYRLEGPIPAMQLVLPDRRKVWPWEPGCQLTIPLLGRP